MANKELRDLAADAVLDRYTPAQLAGMIGEAHVLLREAAPRMAYPATRDRMLSLAQLLGSLANRYEAIVATRAPAVPEGEDTKLLDWLDETNRAFSMGWEVRRAPLGNLSVTSVVTLGGKPQPIRAAIAAARADAIQGELKNG